MRASLMKEGLPSSWLIVTLYMEDYKFDELVNQQFFHRALTTEQEENMVETRAKRLKRLKRETWDTGVFVDILSRLPVKSICSFKSVCKSWHSMLSDTYFAKKQLAHSRENPTFIACPTMDEEMKLYWLRLGSLRLFDLNTIDPAERSPEDRIYMISSFNGLVCCINLNRDVGNRFRDVQIWICNPLTGENLLLPQGTPSLEVEPSVGVAYDFDTSHYRVFRLFGAGIKIPEEKNEIPEEHRSFKEYPYGLVFECEVYSSITGSWENIGHVPRIPMRAGISPFRSAHTFAGGKIFWLVSLGDEGKMLSVDMEGRFEVLRLPPYDDYAREDERITEGPYYGFVNPSIYPFTESLLTCNGGVLP